LDAVAGAIGGALFGFVIWLAWVPSLWPSTLGFFPYDVLAFTATGAVLGAVLGYWYGHDFFRWVRDHWPGSSEE
jgi:hypothetical protein